MLIDIFIGKNIIVAVLTKNLYDTMPNVVVQKVLQNDTKKKGNEMQMLLIWKNPFQPDGWGYWNATALTLHELAHEEWGWCDQ